ncbi:hypothetical protein ACDQ55_16110 [Chitinophaga sp. 30R24]|uniref:hypothetical protein n=1 Tax=Chitinophaga sp. 30R24 TaxID=3248838 RepID=UPI003B91CD1B
MTKESAKRPKKDRQPKLPKEVPQEDMPEDITEDDADISNEEKELLEEASTTDPTYTEELRMRGAKVDTTNDDPPKEVDSLDVPGSELDDTEKAIGAEDEENDEYN